MKKIIFYTVLVGLLNSCIGEDIIDDTQTMNERLSILSNMSNSDTLLVGDTLQVMAEFYGINGEIMSTTKTWESSRPEIASVSQTGKLVGLTEGVTNITVSSNGLKDERLIEVIQLERIEVISSTQTSVFVGDSIMLSANYYNTKGQLIATSVIWEIDNSTLATLKINGNHATLIGNVAGSVNARAIANGVDDELIVTIVDDTNAVANIELQSNTTNLMVGESVQFQSTVRNVNGSILSNKQVSYSSSNNSVLTINNSGLATSLSAGAATIQATSENAVSNGISVLVSQAVTTSRSGAFSGRGSYTVNGNVTMRVENGGLVLDFTNFSSSNGPGLYIYLGNSVNSGISIEALNRRSGSFMVNLPSSISIDDYNFVLIWCQPFGLTFGSAQLN
ncbi:MAG: hypothetical protein ACI9DK_002590 [Vicingaceae bacterium]|jgi:hypothetical protein